MAAPAPAPLPTVTVIVPTYDRPAGLQTCLIALAEQDYPRDRFEVIVVDDGSRHAPASVTGEFRDRLLVTLLRQDNAGPAAARNTGATAAGGEYVAFTDDDCVPNRDWLRRLATALRTAPDALVGGRCVNALEANLYASASHTIIDVVYRHFDGRGRRAMFFPSNNMAAPRRRFGEIGGFDPTFRWSEDRDLCDRWSARGWPLVVAADARVDHAHAMGLPGFVKQHFGYGRGAWRFHRARARRGTGRFRVDPAFYLACLREPFRVRPLSRAIPIALLLAVWQAANAAGFGYEALRECARVSGAGVVPRRPGRTSARRGRRTAASAR